MDKLGIFKFGYVSNTKNTQEKESYSQWLSRITRTEISKQTINDNIESPECIVEYFDKQGNSVTDSSNALVLRFSTPYQYPNGARIWGYFKRDNTTSQFVGVRWGNEDYVRGEKYINLRKYGSIHSKSWDLLSTLIGKTDICEQNISSHISSDIELLNGAGYPQSSNGEKVTMEFAKFIKFSTDLHDRDGLTIDGWFTKDSKGRFYGIDWGTTSVFRQAIKQRENHYVGRMIFESIDECNEFLEKLKEKTLPEPWEYKNRKNGNIKYPILKSYLEFELDRLFHEHENLKWSNKIVYSNDQSYLLFNTNLIDKFGHDLIVVGKVNVISGREFISNLEISPNKIVLKRYGFDSNCEALPPKFFHDINEIVFHSDWDVDTDMNKYEHIIEERRERFPEKYRELSTDELGLKLDHAIDFARRIAQRNYKFIVPMYYPTKRQIQLLMPIYLETSYSAHPDFALVLTPHPDEKDNTGFYRPETILGLDEVYQDARLIAKPEESWLNPEMIE